MHPSFMRLVSLGGGGGELVDGWRRIGLAGELSRRDNWRNSSRNYPRRSSVQAGDAEGENPSLPVTVKLQIVSWFTHLTQKGIQHNPQVENEYT